jgi:hypothetical protein
LVGPATGQPPSAGSGSLGWFNLISFNRFSGFFLALKIG